MTPADELVAARLATAQWILERQLGWIAAADVKVGALLALHTAALTGLAVAFTTAEAQGRTGWGLFCSVAAAICSVLALFFAALAVRPHKGGPPTSLVFFGRICAMSRHEYTAALTTANDKALLEDLAAQVHRNAEIASSKYGSLANSLNFTFLGSVFFVAAVCILVKV